MTKIDRREGGLDGTPARWAAPAPWATASLLALGLAFAAPMVQAQDHSADLSATTDQGVPDGWSEEDWRTAEGSASASAEDGERVVTFEASNLVPEGLYTLWWVNPGTMGIGMSMGPGGGLPDNEFRADGDGAAEVTLRVPADNDYERMVVAYHADDQTHGEEAGAMGEITFEHLSGPWPGPAGEDS